MLKRLMLRIPLLGANFRKGPSSLHHLLGTLVVLILGIGLIASNWQEAPQPISQIQEQIIPAEEFSRIIRDFSEEGGYFLSDNFISNETSYLHVLGKLGELAATG